VLAGWPVQFIEHSAIKILRKKHGITADALVEKVLPLLCSKSRLQAIGGLKLPRPWAIARVAAAIRLGLRKSRA
jgi:hypothetical protein